MFVPVKIVSRKRSRNLVVVQVENLDDLWSLYNLIATGDRVEGKTSRRIVVTDREDEKGERRMVFLAIEVEQVEFHEFSNRLRVKGKILEGPEDLVTLHTYHTFNVEEGTTVGIIKETWTPYAYKLLEDAERRKTIQKVLVVAIDAGDAVFAEIGDYYQKTSLTLSETIPGKRFGNVKDSTNARNAFFAEVLKNIERAIAATHYTKVVIAGPGFTREHFMEHCLTKNPSLKPLLATEATSSATPSGIRELVKKQSLQALLKDSRIVEESKLVEEFFTRLGKDTKDIAYGYEEIKKAADIGAVEDLLVSDEMMRRVHAEKNPEMLSLLKDIEASKGRINILSTLHDAGEQLRGIGGLAALLRFRLGY